MKVAMSYFTLNVLPILQHLKKQREGSIIAVRAGAIVENADELDFESDEDEDGTPMEVTA